MTTGTHLPQPRVDLRFAAVELDPDAVIWETVVDHGVTVRATRCGDGTHVLSYGEYGRWAVSRDGHSIHCQMSDGPPHVRFLLDTVLWWSALRRGVFLQHACVVAHRGHAVAIEAPSGTGKTTLALALLHRGWSLISDDVLAFRQADRGLVMALAGPPVVRVKAAATAPSDRGVTLEPAGASPGDLPLAAYVHYRRRDSLKEVLGVERPDPLAYFGASWAIPGERDEAAHFAALADLATHVPRWSFSVPENSSADETASTLERFLEAST